MRTFSRVMVIGRVGRDVEVRLPSNGGTSWATMSVATSRARRDGDAWVEETEWHAVKLFGRDAEYAAKWGRRGALVAVEGSLSYERYADAEGHKRTTVRILAERLSVLVAAPERTLEAEPAAEAAPEAPAEEGSSEVAVAIA